jgi:hypothetical protein
MSQAHFSFDCASFEGRIRFVIKIDSDKNIAFDGMRVAPDVEDFFRKKFEIFREFLNTPDPAR